MALDSGTAPATGGGEGGQGPAATPGDKGGATPSGQGPTEGGSFRDFVDGLPEDLRAKATNWAETLERVHKERDELRSERESLQGKVKDLEGRPDAMSDLVRLGEGLVNETPDEIRAYIRQHGVRKYLDVLKTIEAKAEKPSATDGEPDPMAEIQDLKREMERLRGENRTRTEREKDDLTWSNALAKAGVKDPDKAADLYDRANAHRQLQANRGKTVSHEDALKAVMEDEEARRTALRKEWEAEMAEKAKAEGRAAPSRSRVNEPAPEDEDEQTDEETAALEKELKKSLPSEFVRG